METVSSAEEGKNKNELLKKIGDFALRNLDLILAPLIVAVAFLVALWTHGAYPFGTGYTIASFDMSAQIVPFIGHVFDVLEGRSSLFYSHAIVGGADVLGSFLYFFVSPFSFLFLILGENGIAEAVSFVYLFKVMAVAFAGAWYAKKMFSNIPKYLCAAVGVVYAYCGYMFLANTYSNWVDFLIYLPFAAWAFKRFVESGKFLLFSVLMACCVYTCFSIACFSMFTAFPILIAYALFCVEKEKKNKFIAYLCLAFVVTVLISLPILLPALGAFNNSARGGDLFENLWKGWRDFSALDSSSSSSLGLDSAFGFFIDPFSEKISYVLADGIFIALTIIWFYRNGLKTGFAKFMLVSGVLTLLPVFVDEAMSLLNMGSYMAYALRFGFLNALYFLSGACLCLQSLCFDKNCAYDGSGLNLPSKKEEDIEKEDTQVCVETEKKETQKVQDTSRIWKGILIAVCVLMTSAVVFCMLCYAIQSGRFGKIFDGVWDVFAGGKLETWIKGTFLYDIVDYHSGGAYAHSYGSPMPVIFLIITVILLTVGIIAVFKKKIDLRFLSVLLMIVVGTQTLFYNGQLVEGNLSTQHTNVSEYSQLCEVLNDRTEGYFRVKDYGKMEKSGDSSTRVDTITANAPFSSDSNSFSVFSSVIDADNYPVHQLFGYYSNGKNIFKSMHNSNSYNRSDVFGDSFMGYKYFFVPESEVETVNADASLKKYLKPVMVTDENGEEKHLSKGQYYIYENEIVFPLGYRVNSGEYRFVAENIYDSKNRKENQAAFYEFLRGKTLAEIKSVTGSSSLTAVTPETARELSEYLWSKSADVKVEAGKITATVANAVAGECLFLNFIASKGYEVTVNGKKADLIDNDIHFLSVALEEGENVVEFVYKSPYVKHIVLGIAVAIFGLCAVALVLKFTRLMDWCAPVIAWAGIALATALVAFFMLFPTAVWLVKLANVARWAIF